MSTSRVEVGTPSVSLSGWTTTEVCFHGFANLSTTRGEYIESPTFSCFGHQWLLRLFAGGLPQSDEGYIAVALTNKTNKSFKVEYGYSTKDADGKGVIHVPLYTKDFAEVGAQAPRYNSRCNANFANRTTIMELLVDGSLVIEVRMKSMSTDKSITQFIPTNPLCKNVLQKFMDEESADVVFEVVDNWSLQSEEHTNKKSKTTTTLYAHRFILQDISTMLAELCKSTDSGIITTVSITDVKPETFKHMIYYAYGGKLSDEDLKANAKDIINACDKYGVDHLKLEAEATYVKSNEITTGNMMDNLLYADSKNLALLKETVMDYIVENRGDIMGKVSFSNVPGDMITDVLAAVSRGQEAGDSGANSKDYNKMRVGTLRKMLDEKGLEVDGSREAMIALLKEHNTSDDDEEEDNDNNDD